MLRDIGIKLLLLALAISLWGYVASSQTRIGEFKGKVPIEVRNIKTGLAATLSEGTISLKISAPAFLWSGLSVDDFSVYIDAANFSQGTNEVDLTAVVNDKRVQVLEKNPNRVLLTLEPLTTKKIKAETLFSGNPAKGFVVSKTTITPEMVTVSGAQTIIKNLTQAMALIELNGEQSSLARTVALSALDANGQAINNLTFSPSVVFIEVDIKPSANVRTVGVRPRFIGDQKEGYWIKNVKVDPSVLTLSGDRRTLSTLDYINTKPIDVTGLSSDRIISVELELPSQIQIVENVKKVLVNVHVELIESVKSVAARIVFKNIPKGYRVTGTDLSTISVTISGQLNLITNANSENVSVVLNLKGKKQGVYTIQITKGMIVIPSDLHFVSFTPSSIVVTIEKI